jgi:hypothetical protein
MMEKNANIGNKMMDRTLGAPSVADDNMAAAHKIALETYSFLQFLFTAHLLLMATYLTRI